MLEKDLWVVWTLHNLFALEGQTLRLDGFQGGVMPTMAFKGGTSLSKVYRVIEGFSEDVGIAFNQQAFQTGQAVFAEIPPSRRSLERHQQRETELANLLLKEFVKPNLLEQSKGLLTYGEVQIEEHFETDGSMSLLILYPSLTSDGSLLEGVKLEAGGRNPTEPLERAVITSDLAAFVQSIEYPTATVQVLKAERTFWEKVTLIHAECHRNYNAMPKLERKSRHWSDLVEMYLSPIGRSALGDRALLETVVKHKQRFYHNGWANYALCLTNRFQLIPSNKDVLQGLEADYLGMGRFFFGNIRPFSEILQVLEQLESEINQSYGQL
jgi:hypothetical protein